LEASQVCFDALRGPFAMIEIRFRDTVFDGLQGHLRQPNHEDEEGAVLLARESRTNDALVLLVTDVIKVPDSGLIHKGPGGLTVDPEFLAPIIKRARLESASVILTHSHPFSDSSVYFSSIDDMGEKSLMPKLQERITDRAHGAIVFGRRSVAARVWLPNARSSVPVDRVTTVGSRIERHLDKTIDDGELGRSERFTRQVLAFSQAGQVMLGGLRVGIVGVGGIGSQVLESLVHVGVRHFILVDHDVVEASNLSRLIGATDSDASSRQPKVEVMKRAAKAIDSGVHIQAVCGNVYDSSVATLLKAADVIFCCTDTMVSRMVLTRFPKQFFIPLIDVGVNIQIADGEVSRIGGRVMVLGPDDPCLDCLEYLNHDVLTYELSKLGAVGATPYVTGMEEPVPAVVSYNATLASLAVNEFLKLVLSNFPLATGRTFQVFDGIAGVVRRVSLEPRRRCGICEEFLGMGDSKALPVTRTGA
jgi:molybdopterin-synthase adenylyltransferase